MKSLGFICLTLVSFAVFGQVRKNPYYLPDSSLNHAIITNFRKMVNIKNYDTLCVASCVFIKFIVSRKTGVTDVSFSGHAPLLITKVLKEALTQTTPYWKVKKKEVFILPVVYIFEAGCLPVNKSSEAVLYLHYGFQDYKPEVYFPGDDLFAPIRCILLNPLLIKSDYY